jgi:hypothetical protein
MSVAVLAGILPAGAVAAAPAPSPSAPPSVPAASAPAGEPPAAGPQVLTWGIAPSGRNGPDGRAAFNYKLDPGAELTDYVGVSNYSDQPVTVDLYASDAFTTAAGGFDLLPADRQPTDVGTWVVFNPEYRRLQLPARSRVDVPFTLTVPRNATPGDHAGGIVTSVAEAGTDSAGNRVRVDRRVGSRIYLRVTGDLAPAFTVERLDARYTGTPSPVAGGTVTATYRVRNTGNVRLTGRPRMTAAGPFGILERTKDAPQLPEILPGGEYTATVEMRGVVPLFRLGVDLDLTPVAVNTAVPVQAAGRGTAVWAWPWSQLALLLLLGGAVWFFLYRRRATARKIAAAREQGRTEAAAARAQANGRPDAKAKGRPNAETTAKAGTKKTDTEPAGDESAPDSGAVDAPDVAERSSDVRPRPS